MANCNPDRFGRILKSDQSSRSSVLSFGVNRKHSQAGVRQVRVLSDLYVGETGRLVELKLPAGVQNHLMHMGFVPDALVRVVHRAPAGDPTVYAVDGIEIALRRETARSIRVTSPELQEEPAKELAEAV
jgi:Fe2+ transport system protein FeoA